MKFWRWSSTVALAGLMLSGCAAPEKITLEGHPLEPALELRVEMPEDPVGTRFGLAQYGQLLKVGDPLERGFEVFERPPRATSFSDMPEPFAPPFQAEGWETSGSGFGMIGLQGRVAAAMVTYERTDPSRLERTLDDYRDLFGPETLTKETAMGSYRFWEEGDQRLAIVGSQDSQGRQSVTVALGLIPVMDHLRLSPEAAQEDMAEAERLHQAASGG